LIVVVPSFYRPEINKISPSFVFTNLIIGFTSLIMIILEARKTMYSLHLIHWLFHFSFFFIAPIIQYLHNKFMWGNLTSDDLNVLIKANILIILWQWVWIIIAIITEKKHIFKENTDEFGTQIGISSLRFFILFVLCVIDLFYFVQIIGFGGLFARGSEKLFSDNSSLNQIIYNVGKSLPIVLLVASYYQKQVKQNKKTWSFMILISAVLVLLLNFPTAVSRFWMATVYIGIILTFFKFKSKNLFTYLLICGLLILFPILGSTRHASNLNDWINIMLTNGYTNNILTGDYDAFSMINHTIRYIDIYGVTYGHQLLGALLFFIPRTFWESKPIGSGPTVSEGLGLSFDNISNPLISEGLINFGLPGLFIFAFLFSFATKKLDLHFWSNGNSIFKILYPFYIGLFFFMMRGDLLSTFSLTVSFSFAFFIFLRPSKKR